MRYENLQMRYENLWMHYENLCTVLAQVNGSRTHGEYGAKAVMTLPRYSKH